MLRRTKCPLFGLWHPVPFLNCSSILCAPVPNTIQTKGAPPTSSSSSFSSPPSCLCLPHICYSPPSPMTPQLLLQLEGVLPSPMTSPEACVRRCKGNVGPLTLLRGHCSILKQTSVYGVTRTRGCRLLAKTESDPTCALFV